MSRREWLLVVSYSFTRVFVMVFFTLGVIYILREFGITSPAVGTFSMVIALGLTNFLANYRTIRRRLWERIKNNM